MVLWACVFLVTVGPARAAGGPSVAVLNLEGKGDLPKDTADLLTDHLVTAVRDSKAFARVSSARDVEAAMGMEQQKQMMNCASDSCLAEIAGALNVDFVLTGSVGRLGKEVLLNLRLVTVRSGQSTASVSARVGDSESGLLDALPRAVDALLRDAGLKQGNVPPAVVSSPPKPAPVAQPPADARPGQARNPMWLAAAGVSVGGAVGAAVLGLALGVGAVLVRLLVPRVPGSGAAVYVWVPGYLAAGVLGGILLVVAAAIVVVGAATGGAWAMGI